jgi:hypothetical protein
MLRRFALLVGFTLSASAGTADASPRQVERALELYQAGQLTRALTAFERALASGDNAPADMPMIYRHLGELRAGAGDAAGAEEAFKRLLELDPSATPGAEWSPVVVEPFERARAAVRGPPPPPPPNGGEQNPPNGGGGEVRGVVDPNAGVDTVVPVAPRAVPQHGALGPLLGSHVWTAPDESRSSGIFGSPWLWGGVVAFVAVATTAAIVASGSGADPFISVPEQ